MGRKKSEAEDQCFLRSMRRQRMGAQEQKDRKKEKRKNERRVTRIW